MPQTVTIAKTVNPDTFAAQLKAALPALVRTRPDGALEATYQLVQQGSQWAVVVPDSTDLTAVQSVITAHDSTVQSTAQQQAAQDTTDVQALMNSLQTMLQQLQNDTTTLQGALTLALAQPILQHQNTALTRAIRVLAVLVRRMGGA